MRMILRRLLAALSVGFALLVVGALPAGATTIWDGHHRVLGADSWSLGPVHSSTFLLIFANVAQWSVLVGALQPLVVAVLKQDRFSKPVNTGIALAFSVVAAIVTAAANGHLTLASWATSLSVIYASAITTYYGLWHPTGIEPAVQTATSPGGAAKGRHRAATGRGRVRGPGDPPGAV